MSRPKRSAKRKERQRQAEQDASAATSATQAAKTTVAGENRPHADQSAGKGLLLLAATAMFAWLTFLAFVALTS